MSAIDELIATYVDGFETIAKARQMQLESLNELSALRYDLVKAVDIFAALAMYGVALPDEAYTLIETYHGKL